VRLAVIVTINLFGKLLPKKILFGKLSFASSPLLDDRQFPYYVLSVSWLLIDISCPVVAYLHVHFTLFLSHWKCNCSLFLANLLQIILFLSILSSIFSNDVIAKEWISLLSNK
jgi:hypothetical protein